LEAAFRGGKKSVTFEEIVPSPTGRIRRKAKKLEITIPPGVQEGTKLRLSGQGQAGPLGSAPGDLYVTIHLRAHPTFKVNGADLEVDVPITPWEAVFGARIEIPVIGGKAAVSIPAGSQTGKKLRLRGRGLRKTTETRGDLYATLRIVVPSDPTEEERRLFADLSRASNFKPRS
jgi:DnaJ-class molecular chaperone